ncbi:MAG TPA: hypothetical protein PK395_19725 [bacterium]|nr:hypothetical protein [bacterium]HQQ01183.1 hypothetical protein [bacterium]
MEPTHPSLEMYDTQERWRCPQLGGPVTFNYCRRMNRKLPCSKVVECWVGVFDIAGYLLSHFSEDEIRGILSAPKPNRMTRILNAMPNTPTPGEE